MNTPTQARKALITGASTGIGAVYAERFAQRGYDLILVARDAAKLAEHAARITAATGRRVETIAADLTSKADLRVVEARLRDDKAITALVNNAGFGATKSLAESNIDDLEAMIDLNVTALTRLTSAIVPNLIQRGAGTIINISSVAAIAPEILNGAYGGTKAYVLAFTQSLHHELSPKGIRVQAVLPGATSTPFWARAGIGSASNLPAQIVMPAEEMVDASLAGFDLGELVTIPSLPDAADWERADNARKALGPGLSRSSAAARYKTAVAA
ncbi:MAG TPA: SDR family oxidoreductase [Pararobbsia sp.]|jgi:short-subunit dehydrogenase|nr:SDR family oxidoreductase [Pararobbsia sp.]